MKRFLAAFLILILAGCRTAPVPQAVQDEHWEAAMALKFLTTPQP